MYLWGIVMADTVMAYIVMAELPPAFCEARQIAARLPPAAALCCASVPRSAAWIPNATFADLSFYFYLGQGLEHSYGPCPASDGTVSTRGFKLCMTHARHVAAHVSIHMSIHIACGCVSNRRSAEAATQPIGPYIRMPLQHGGEHGELGPTWVWGQEQMTTPHYPEYRVYLNRIRGYSG